MWDETFCNICFTSLAKLIKPKVTTERLIADILLPEFYKSLFKDDFSAPVNFGGKKFAVFCSSYVGERIFYIVHSINTEITTNSFLVPADNVWDSCVGCLETDSSHFRPDSFEKKQPVTVI